ncbi:hypothetical protein GGG16DRAFT_64811 [Schizophyllum commune]
MDENREAVCDHYGSVVQRSVADFIKHFLPPRKLTNKELGRVITKLKKGWRTHDFFDEQDIDLRRTRSKEWKTKFAPLEADAKGRTRWTDFAYLPSECDGTEKDVYDDLVVIYGQIVQCCLEVNDSLEQTSALESNGTRKLQSEKANSSMPDAVHQLTTDQGGVFDWDSTVVAEEYKTMKWCTRKPSPSQDHSQAAAEPPPNVHVCQNTKKVLWSMHHMLRTDFRRRFAYGITIEDTEVRLWHYNRAVIVISDAFDLNKDAKTLADVYSRFAFATREELGYDLSIELLRDHPPLSLGQSPADNTPSDQYRITVCGEKYITVKPLANQTAENGIGSCTRVYQVYKESDESIDPKQRTYYAIKDSWLETGRRTEFEIYNDIMKRIEEHDWKGLYDAAPTTIPDLCDYASAKPADPLHDLSVDERKQFFIGIIACEKVKAGGVVDDTHAVIGRNCGFPIRGRKVYAVSKRAKLHVGQVSVLSGVVGNEHMKELPVQERGRFLGEIPARQHHRIVMELGERLLDVAEVKQVFSMVKDASYALFLLHSVGLLYRDISAGNILRRRDGRGVLTDLEYVRSVTDTNVHTMRTGTADFCALEVVTGWFISGPPQAQVAKRIWRDPDAQNATSSPPPRLTVAPGGSRGWRFREVHDLESIFWLYLWLLLRHNTNLPVPPEYDPVKKHDEYYDKIFPHHIFWNTPDRCRVLASPEYLAETLSSLPPDWSKYADGTLEIFREDLWSVYTLGAIKPLPPTMWAMVYLVCGIGERIPGLFTPPVRSEILNVIYKRNPRPTLSSSSAAGNVTGSRESARSSRSKRGRQEVEDSAEQAAGESSGTDPERLTAPRPKRKKGAAGRH